MNGRQSKKCGLAPHVTKVLSALAVDAHEGPCIHVSGAVTPGCGKSGYIRKRTMAVSDLSASTPQSTESPSARPAGTRVVIPDQVEPSISIGVAMAVLAVAYYVSGKLGLLLALPPGYATAVFPPSGIALAGF